MQHQIVELALEISRKRRAYLDQNLGALGVSLSPADLGRIDDAAPRGAAVGARYPEEYMSRLGI